MIVVWPLIVSKTVNQNILPGVCKALEKYVFTEQTDKVINAANDNIKANSKNLSTYLTLKAIGGRLKMRLENTDIGKTTGDYISEDWIPVTWSDEPLLEAPKKPEERQQVHTQQWVDPVTGHNRTQTDMPRPEPHEPKTPYNDQVSQSAAKNIIDKALKNEAPKFGRVDSSAISTEPTWNTVTDQQGNTKAIGVKVVPFVIDNEQSLIKLMLSDRYRESLSTKTHIQARRILRLIHRIANTAWKRTIGFMFSWTGFVDEDLVNGTISKNWKNDVILQNTVFKKNMFILLNKMDLTDDFTKEAGGVKKLFNLGWTSLVIADDVNKVVTFCMESYKGMCSMVNYGFLYADARTQSQVYSDIEDIRKSSGPLFRMKRRKKSMITDNLAQYKLDQYSQQILESNSYLQESIDPELIKKISQSPKQLISNLKAMQSAVKRKDFKTAKNIHNKLIPKNKKIDINRVVNEAKEKIPDFKDNYDLSYRVFKNSLPGVKEPLLQASSTLMSCVAGIHKNKKYNLKNDLKKIVLDTRSKAKTLKEDNDEFAKDINVAFAFVLILFFFSASIITMFLYFLAAFIPSVGVAFLTWWPIILFILSIIIIWKYVGGGGDDDE